MLIFKSERILLIGVDTESTGIKDCKNKVRAGCELAQFDLKDSSVIRLWFLL